MSTAVMMPGVYCLMGRIKGLRIPHKGVGVAALQEEIRLSADFANHFGWSIF